MMRSRRWRSCNSRMTAGQSARPGSRRGPEMASQVTNLRRRIHKVTTETIRDNQAVYVEGLNVPGKKRSGFLREMLIIETESQLEDALSAPNAADVDFMSRLAGDVVILGAGGKMGPSLATRVKRATDAAGGRGPRVARLPLSHPPPPP